VAEVGVGGADVPDGNGGGPVMVKRGGGGGTRLATLELAERIASISTSPLSTTIVGDVASAVIRTSNVVDDNVLAEC
jgi:hypothetical protein